MTQKYKVVRIPVEAYLKEKSKLNEINKRLTQLSKKNKRIPLTTYFNFRANRPIFIYDDELLNYFGKSKRKYITL